MTFSQRAVEAAAAHILRELDDRGLLKGVDDDLFSEIANDVAKAALTALVVDGVALRGWQPIETAILNVLKVTSETLLLAHAEKKWIRFGKWYVQEGCWYYSGTNERSQWAQVRGDDPTHWQPLPQPPAASDGEERNSTPQDKP